MEQKSKPFCIALCGASVVEKSALAEAIRASMFPDEVAVVHGADPFGGVRESDFDLKTLTVSSMWIVEAGWLDQETKLQQRPRIFVDSIIDRFALTRLANLNMDLHFNRVLSQYLTEYTLLVYVPLPEVRSPLQVMIDTEIRRIIYRRSFSAQVVLGTIEQKRDLVTSALRLRVGDLKDLEVAPAPVPPSVVPPVTPPAVVPSPIPTSAVV